MDTGSGTSRSLSLLLRGLSGAEIPVEFMSEADDTIPDACLRPILSRQKILLPRSQAREDTPGLNIQALASIAHAAAHVLYSTPARDVSRLKPMGVAVVSAFEDARVELSLIRQFPGVRRWFCQAMQEPSKTESVFSALIAKLSYGLLNEHSHTDDYWVNKAKDLFFSHAMLAGLDDYDGYRAIASVLANDLGQMRIQFNPQAYVNPVAYRDDNSYLWNFSAENSVPQWSISISQSESLSAQVKDNQEESQWSSVTDVEPYHYAEWDYRSEIERKEWCSVFEHRHGLSGGHLHADMHSGALKKYSRMYQQNSSASGREKLFRQPEGDMLDLNAAVDSFALAGQKGFGDERHYIRHTSRKKSVSLLLILDLSASVGYSVQGQSQTILELEKSAAITMAEYANAQGDRIAIHGFCSDKRTGVHYSRYLDFDQPFALSGLHALQNAEPRYSTRTGAALRHGLRFFNDADTDVRAIIVITDGAPSDIDVFDPQYLVEDARKVVHDACKEGIDLYGLVLDPGAASQNRKIFGSSRLCIVSRAQSLSIHLERLYRQIRS